MTGDVIGGQRMTGFFWKTDDDGSASGRIEFAERGPLYFLITRIGEAYQCWDCGDDTSPLSPDQAFALGPRAPGLWLALPESVRRFALAGRGATVNGGDGA